MISRLEMRVYTIYNCVVVVLAVAAMKCDAVVMEVLYRLAAFSYTTNAKMLKMEQVS